MESEPKPGTSKDAVIDDIYCGIGSGSSHAVGGIKTSFHGYIYQVKLAMFFILRALVKNFIFDIGTEVDPAKTFDDLVFEFVTETEKRVIFLQAKHRLDEMNTINEIDLLNEDGHFSMRKHYSSYGAILKADYFKEILKDAKVTLVLCTNIGINDSILDKFEEVRTGEFANNGFLHPGTAAAYAKFYKLVPDTPFYDHLVCHLEKYELPLTLAQLLAKKVVNNKKKSIKIDNQFNRYRECLLNKVFDHGVDTTGNDNSYYVSFKENFLVNENLPTDLFNFRQEFINSFINGKNNSSSQCVTDETVIKELSGVMFKVTKKFISGEGTKQNKAKEYLDALIFAVNQPSEEKLGDIVEKEVGEYTGLIDRKSVASKFKAYILDWVKQKQGLFLKKIDVEEQFAVWSQTDQSHRLINEIKTVCYAFEQDDVIVNISNFLNDEIGQIICLYYSHQLLTEIKLCQALEYRGAINNEFVFSDINILSEQVNTKKCPVKAFNSLFCNNAFIIIRKTSEIKQKEEMLLRRLFDIVKINIQNCQKLEGKKAKTAKKRILMLIPFKHAKINERNDFFQNLDSEGILRIILEDDEVKFSNLNDESRRKLFEKMLHQLMGNEIGEIVIDTFNDFTLQSIWNVVRYNLEYKNKPINDHLDNWKELLSKFVKDDVMSLLISGDSDVYKDLNKNYNEMTQFVSEKICNDALSTFITESTRADTTVEEKVLSFFLKSASLVTPLFEEWNKD